MALTKVKLIADGVVDVDNLAANHGITTDNIGEGTALYYTDARVSSYLTTNSYATEGYVTTAVSNLVDSAPSTLDTLNELAAALGDDPNFATTVTNSIAGKLPLAGGTLTGGLTVQGYITSSTNEGKLILNSTAANGKQYEFISIDTGNLGLYDGTAYRLWVGGSGNVGIGTTSPTGTYGKLTVNGSISLLGDQNTKLEIGRYSAGASNSYIKLGANSNSLRITNNTDTADLLYINNDGSILIGQATKRDQEKFAVVGTTANYLAEIRETGTGGSENSGLLIYYTSAAPNSRNKHFLLNADNTATKSFLSSDGGAYFSGDVGIGDSTPNFVTSGRRVLELNGASEALMSFAINGSWQYYIQTTSTKIFHSSGGKDFVIDTGSSNVGIGTSTPSQKLHVEGNTLTQGLYIPGLVTLPNAQGAIQADIPNTSYNAFRLRDVATDTSHTIHGFASNWSNGASSGHLNLEGITAVSFGTWVGPNMIIHHSTGNVGIGIGDATPSNRLHVYSAGNTRIRIDSGNNNAGIMLSESGSNKWSIASVSGGDLQFFSEAGLGNLMRLSSTGNLGIGTTSPQTKLQVNGAVGMRENSSATVPQNVKFVKSGTTSVTFTISVGGVGAWRAGHAFLKVSGAQNGLQEHHSAWYHLKLVHYYLSGVTQSGSSNPALIKDSGGDTGSYTISVTSTSSSNPQEITINISDSDGTTNSMIADIDATFFQGIYGIS